MKRLLPIVIVGFTLLVLWCVRGYAIPEAEVYDRVEDAGYRDLTILRQRFEPSAICSDWVVFDLTALDEQKRRVELSVCAAWPLRGSYVRKQ